MFGYTPFGWFNDNADDVAARKNVAALLPTHSEAILALDVETTGLEARDHQLVSVAIAQPGACQLFQACKVDLALLLPLLRDDRITWVIQNAAFDWHFLAHHLGVDLAHMYDTCAVETILGAAKGERSLRAMTRRYTGVELDKAIATTFVAGKEMTPEQMSYSAMDSLVLFPIMQAQAVRLAARTDAGVALQHKLDEFTSYLAGGPFPQR